MSRLRRGRFITVEGSEGSGKSFHVRRLVQSLRRSGYPVLAVREPGSSRVGEAIREILLQPEMGKLGVPSELFLFEAARAQLVEEVIRPALRRDRLVVCDRFFDATTAYQGYGGGLPIRMVEAIHRIATGGLEPDLTILLDLPVEEGLRRSFRRKGVKDRMERKPLAFHRRVRRGYLALARRYPNRIKVVQVSERSSETQRRIRDIVERLLSR